MSCSLLVDLVLSGLVAAAGRRASAVQRRPTDFWLAAPAGAGALPAAGVVPVGRAGTLGGRVPGGPAIAVGLVGLGGRGLGLLAQLGAALLGLAGHPVPVALHGPDPATADGHDH
jgi:hypothetical protein